MSYSSDMTRKRILISAEKEFLKNGFQKANLRRIAEKSKVTTGALYNYYKSKDFLFEALIGDTAKEFLTLFQGEHDKYQYVPNSHNTTNLFKENSSSVVLILDYIYDNFNLFKLIICCSEGSSYSNYVHQLIEIEEKNTHLLLQKSNYNKDNTIDDFFIHVISSMGIKNMFEAVEHDLPKEKAFAYMNKIIKFYIAGWQKTIEAAQ